ncbi:hypothetical protein LIS90_13695 [Flavobacterium psychrophilum]|uniref:Uncharacterized protein n=2 Tax=Flavobacterium psychrophilum TaxID=96345 RepID=A0A7U2NGW9_FLAPS|nr:hypothetical protein [Flavobacterium psychrophilum]EKT4520660.1 hypothetical protein [Flavobacterium psychrophilum]MBF2092715.1 hypothetical protein [Flavobacterium psychrophilum]MCB6232300.1 hypothetical protein [Flavobacterium psychrophilum]OAE90555.1 hypothetical protein SU65_12520 [Flavobacterium psychrophilum]OJH12868.1 hypothetical protein FPG87_02835 [Flavobacterium psychrophilum]
MSVKEETEILLAKILLSNFDSKNYVDWAISVIESGIESNSLFILAGLDDEDTEIREKYFRKVVEELKIEINYEDFALLQNYAKFIAEKVINGTLSQSKGLSTMNEIVTKSDYDPRYMQFFELDEDLDYLNYSNNTIFNLELTKENKQEYIREEFILFLEIENLKIDDKIREYSICKNCNYIGKPKLKVKYQFRRPYKYYQWKCGKCNSGEIEHFSSQNGKRKIIENIKNIC